MSVGFWQILLVLIVVFVIFGGGKLSQAMGDLGKGMRNFRDGLKAEDDKKLPPKDDSSNNA